MPPTTGAPSACALGVQQVCGLPRRGLQGDDQTAPIRNGFDKEPEDWFVSLVPGICGGSLVHGDSKYFLARM